MRARIKDQPAVGKLIAKYDQLPSRDRQALVVLVVALLLAVLYFAVWAPASAFNEKPRPAVRMPANCWPGCRRMKPQSNGWAPAGHRRVARLTHTSLKAAVS